MKIAIVGAGLGGLCLAQNLRRRGIAAQVYERDRSPSERPQGYRLHLDADGINALHDSLSPELFALFDATAMKAAPFTTIVDPSLAVRMRRSHDQHGGTEARPHEGLPAHLNVNRATLREVLLSGIDVTWGRRIESPADIDADIIVGAEGIRSPLRALRAPHLTTQDSGVRAIYGRVPMAAASTCIPQQAREDVFTVAVDERKCFLGLGPVAFPQPPASLGLGAQDDYVVTIIGGPADRFGTEPDLQARALSVLASWPESTRRIISAGDPASFFWVEMWTSVPGPLGPPSNITLLGDAIHAMTPTLGRGANVAMRDAAILGSHLAAVAAGKVSVAAALAAYEREMLAYGFDVVRTAAEMGTRLMGQKPLPT